MTCCLTGRRLVYASRETAARTPGRCPTTRSSRAVSVGAPWPPARTQPLRSLGRRRGEPLRLHDPGRCQAFEAVQARHPSATQVDATIRGPAGGRPGDEKIGQVAHSGGRAAHVRAGEGRPPPRSTQLGGYLGHHGLLDTPNSPHPAWTFRRELGPGRNAHHPGPRSPPRWPRMGHSTHHPSSGGYFESTGRTTGVTTAEEGPSARHLWGSGAHSAVGSGAGSTERRSRGGRGVDRAARGGSVR